MDIDIILSLPDDLAVEAAADLSYADCANMLARTDVIGRPTLADGLRAQLAERDQASAFNDMLASREDVSGL